MQFGLSVFMNEAFVLMRFAKQADVILNENKGKNHVPLSTNIL